MNSIFDELIGMSSNDDFKKSLLADFTMISAFAALKLVAITREERDADEKAMYTIQKVIDTWEQRMLLHFESERVEVDEVDDEISKMFESLTPRADEIKKFQEKNLKEVLETINTIAFAGMEAWTKPKMVNEEKKNESGDDNE